VTVLFRLLGLGDGGPVLSVAEWAFRAGAQIPAWLWAVFCGAGAAAAMMNFLPHNTMPRATRVSLCLLRLAGFGLAGLMLARTELEMRFVRGAKPRVAILCDASASMDVRDAEGRTRREAACDIADKLWRRLKGKAEVSRYSFAWDIEDGITNAVMPGCTRIASSVERVIRREMEADAIVIVTDGNDTGGDRGLLVAPALAARGTVVYPIVLGDTNSPPRAEVKIVSGSPYIRLGDETMVSAVASGTGLPDQTVRAVLYEEGVAQPLAVRENVRIGREPVRLQFVVKPSRPGERVYRIALEGVRGCASDRRLVAEHRLEVVDARIRVLYVDIPRDERKILGLWLARDPVVDLATLTMMPKGGWYGQGALRHRDVGNGLPGGEADLCQYDVIILGDIPRSYFREGGDVSETRLRWLADFVARRGGGLVTLGGRSVYAAGNYQDSALASVLPFEIAVSGDPQVPREFAVLPTPLGLSHPVMQLENDPEANREAWASLPMLDGCNRVGPVKPGAILLAEREVGGVRIPVIAVQDVGRGKVLSLSADTTWRWEMMREPEEADRFRRFWGNVVRYVAPDPRLQPNRPMIQRSRANPAAGDTVTLSARLVDSLYRPVRDAELKVEVCSPSGKIQWIYPCDSRRRPGVYEYDIVLDEPGEWHVSASNRNEVTQTSIRAGDSDEEMDDPRARPALVESLAVATGGHVVQPSQIESLAGTLCRKTRTVVEHRVVPIWNLPLTFLLFLAVVSLDCLIRKRRGMA